MDCHSDMFIKVSLFLTDHLSEAKVDTDWVDLQKHVHSEQVVDQLNKFNTTFGVLLLLWLHNNQSFPKLMRTLFFLCPTLRDNTYLRLGLDYRSISHYAAY